MNGDEKMNEKEDNIGLWIILIFLVLGFFNFLFTICGVVLALLWFGTKTIIRFKRKG